MVTTRIFITPLRDSTFMLAMGKGAWTRTQKETFMPIPGTYIFLDQPFCFIPSLPLTVWHSHNGSNQKWFWDAKGRLRNRKDESKCMEVDGNNKNLRMVTCLDNDRSRFVFPSTFPRVESHVVDARDSKCKLSRGIGRFWCTSILPYHCFLHTSRLGCPHNKQESLCWQLPWWFEPKLLLHS